MARSARSDKALCLILFCSFFGSSTQDAQLFETLTAGKAYFGSAAEVENSANAEDRGGGGGGGGGGGSGYGAPSPSYGAPAPSYGAPAPSYGAPAPSYKPTYQSGKGSKFNFKTIDIPVPDIKLPNPLDFKAGVLRSKGRIASGLLHVKADLLRAGANILAKKANALDEAAQAIPAIKASLIKGMKGSFKGSDGGYGGAVLSSSYGAPAPSSNYGAPSSGYGAPAPSSGYNAPAPAPSYNAPSSNFNSPSSSYSAPTDYGTPQGPVIGPTAPSSSYNGPSVGLSSTFPSGGGSNSYVAPSSPVGNTYQPSSNLGVTNVVSNSFSASAVDSYGVSTGGIITSNNAGSFPVQQSVGSSYSNPFINGNPSPTVTTIVQNQDSYGSPVSNSANSGSSSSSFVSSSGGNTATNSDIVTGDGGDGEDESLLEDEEAEFESLPGLSRFSEKLVRQESRQQDGNGNCKGDAVLRNLLQDIFMGHEVIPDVIDHAPKYPLDMRYKTIKTFPGMRLTAESTRFKPILSWPTQQGALYTVVMSNLDINSRKNRTLAEFWHWFVANVPGDSVDDGDVIFDLLFPLVLPEGDGDHRFGFFVFKQPRRLDYSEEGGPTDSCSPDMADGRGPFRSTKNFQKKYGLELTAATFLIIDYSDTSMEIACEWQKCIGDTINLVSPLRCGNN